MKTYALYHANTRGIRFESGPESVESWRNFNREPKRVGKDYEMVAAVIATDLDDAYTRTQNIDQSWAANPGVYTDNVHRSTSVGDVFVDTENDRHYMVDSFGFKDVTPD